VTNRDPGAASAALPGAGAGPGGAAGAVAFVGVKVGCTARVPGATVVVLEVGAGSTDDGDGSAAEERGAADAVGTGWPSWPAAPCVPPPHAVPRIAAAIAMSASARVLLVTLVTSKAG
jgi:hypothetical protein